MNNFLLKDFAKEKVESKKASMKDLLKAFDSSEGSGEEHTSGTFFVIFTVPKKSRKSEEKSQLSTRESPAKLASKKDEKAGKEKKESKGKCSRKQQERQTRSIAKNRGNNFRLNVRMEYDKGKTSI